MRTQPSERQNEPVLRKVHVLLIEDDHQDARLIVDQLRRDGFDPEWELVTSEADYLAGLSNRLDIILSNYTLPAFDAATALRLLRQHHLDVPFIVISGTIGEEKAVEVLRQGAADYLLKDRLQRLGASVTNAIERRQLQREYQRAQETADESSRRYRLIFENNPQPMWVFDAETYRFLEVNDTAVASYGYSREEFLSKTIFDIRQPDDRPRLLEALTRPRKSRFDKLGAFKHLKKDGSLIDVDVTSREIEFEGRPARVALSHDVTERRRAEEALLTDQQRTQFALSAGGIGIWNYDAASGRSHWSETLEQMHGLAPFTFGGTMTAFLDLIHAEDRPAMEAEIGRAIAERRDSVLEYRTVLPDGSTRVISCKGRFFRDASDQVVSAVGIGIDVTERRELETQLMQSQKMDAVGQLAGGIAHDFNNLLTAILGYAELLAPVLEHDERQRKDLDEIRKAAVRATRLTGQLLAFSRRQIMQPAVLDLNALVTDVTSLIKRLIGEDIRLKLDLDPSLGHTKADPGQVEQVIVNLAVNARDAMASGGTLTVHTTNADVDGQFFRRHGLKNESGTQRFVVLSISDTGCGMDAAVKKRIFEPFFTTKPKGRGTGLGLATVYGIVKQSGGSIWVYSDPGQGTLFKIYLPRTDQPIVADTVGATAHASLNGSETILLVEDEHAVRTLSQALLERQGYRVLVAADAEQAIRIAERETAPIHLLVTDVVMPGKSGPELFDRLGPSRPNMRALFLSGYTDEAIVRRGVLKAGTPFLQKPFTATALSLKVRELLDLETLTS